MALQGSPSRQERELDARPVHGERDENAAKYREKVDELNRTRDTEIERALTLRAAGRA